MTPADLTAARLLVDRAFRALIAAQKASDKASEARFKLPAGSSRAKVTTANARWMRSAEFRDLCSDRLMRLGVVPGVVLEGVKQ